MVQSTLNIPKKLNQQLEEKKEATGVPKSNLILQAAGEKYLD